jgi:flavin reductase (DIM6/NTAB) family NADH-FMN oxidoreductase RutF
MDVKGAFGDLVGKLDYSMFIVTVRADEERAGCLVGFGCQTSIEPPRFLICLSRKNHTFQVATGADVMAVHVAPEQAGALARLFGSCCGAEMNKFADCAWRPGPGGVPILEECGNWFVGRVLEQIDFGDHVGFLLDPVAAQAEAGEASFMFQHATGVGIEPGHPA